MNYFAREGEESFVCFRGLEVYYELRIKLADEWILVGTEALFNEVGTSPVLVVLKLIFKSCPKES